MLNNAEKQNELNNTYIEKLKLKDERQLKKMLDTLEKEVLKITLEQARLKSKLDDKIKKGHFIKDELMERWRTPNSNLLKAIDEVKNGEVETFSSHKEAMEFLNA